MADLVIGTITGGQVERYAPGDRITFTAYQAVTGGQVVELVTGHGERQVQPAGAASVVAIGVALHDAAAGAIVTVAIEGAWILTATAAAITAGARVACGAGGLVVAAGATPDARAVVGIALADISSGGTGPILLGGSLG